MEQRLLIKIFIEEGLDVQQTWLKLREKYEDEVLVVQMNNWRCGFWNERTDVRGKLRLGRISNWFVPFRIYDALDEHSCTFIWEMVKTIGKALIIMYCCLMRDLCLICRIWRWVRHLMTSSLEGDRVRKVHEMLPFLTKGNKWRCKFFRHVMSPDSFGNHFRKDLNVI